MFAAWSVITEVIGAIMFEGSPCSLHVEYDHWVVRVVARALTAQRLVHGAAVIAREVRGGGPCGGVRGQLRARLDVVPEVGDMDPDFERVADGPAVKRVVQVAGAV